MSHPDEVYVVAIQNPGFAELTNGRYFPSHKDAKTVCDDFHARGMKYMKIFTLSPYIVIKVEWKPGVPADLSNIRQVPAYAASCEEAINAWVAQDTRILSWTYLP